MADEKQQRNFGQLTEDERILIKTLYVQEQYTLPQLARMYNLHYTNFRQSVYYHKWHTERLSHLRDQEVLDKVQKMQGALILETTVGHLRFLDQVLSTFRKIQQGYDEMVERYLYHDQLAQFPLEPYNEFLEVYGKVVKLLAEIKPVTQDLNVYLTQNNSQTNVSVNAGKSENLQIDDRTAREALTKLMQGLVTKHRPPEPKEISVEAVKAVDPARGQYR